MDRRKYNINTHGGGRVKQPKKYEKRKIIETQKTETRSKLGVESRSGCVCFHADSNQKSEFYLQPVTQKKNENL